MIIFASSLARALLSSSHLWMEDMDVPTLPSSFHSLGTQFLEQIICSVLTVLASDVDCANCFELRFSMEQFSSPEKLAPCLNFQCVAGIFKSPNSIVSMEGLLVAPPFMGEGIISPL